MTALELLPCPFCGSDGIDVVEGSTFRWLTTSCIDCGAQGPEVRVQTLGDGSPDEWMRKGRDDAAESWNTRQPITIPPIFKACTYIEQRVLACYIEAIKANNPTVAFAEANPKGECPCMDHDCDGVIDNG